MGTTTDILTTIGVKVNHIPLWAVPPDNLEILAWITLGIIATWAREIIRHYDEDSAHETGFWKCMVMIIPGMFAGFLGGCIAEMSGYASTDPLDPSWLFILTIGYIGPPAMNMLTQTVLGIMQKGLERFGLDYEKQQANNMKRAEEDKVRYTEMRRKIESEQFDQAMEKLQESPDTDQI
jgi:hypothetical protein